MGCHLRFIGGKIYLQVLIMVFLVSRPFLKPSDFFSWSDIHIFYSAVSFVHIFRGSLNMILQVVKCMTVYLICYLSHQDPDR